MPAIPYTPEQLRAIQTTGASVLVSAAAGSGKTAVLAQRCVYLVCDAPADHRCDIDELLVVTFTEAAADEMRSRIIDALRDRAAQSPTDERVGRQIALAESAQISTIHAYCLWIVRRWFSQLGIDPAATVLDANEAGLLRCETLEELLQRNYSDARSTDDPLGTRLREPPEFSARNEVPTDGTPRSPETPSSEQTESRSASSSVDESFRERLIQLVDVYGLGVDRDIAAIVLRLADFVNSLTDPDAWLSEAVNRMRDEDETVLAELAAEFRSELSRQAEHCRTTAKALERLHPATSDFATRIHAHAERLAEWADALGLASMRCRETLERVRREVAEYSFPRAPVVRKAATLPADVRAALEIAKAELKSVREGMFQKRLQRRYALFSVDEWNAGRAAVAWHVRTLVDLVRLFRQAFRARKRSLGVMEFADLERFAFDLLTTDGVGLSPSDVARAIHRRFTHVLVDEFQDVNPLQEGILRLSSRESDRADLGNLFAVGDVKQSIYRFRLAEPAVFTRRLRRFRDSSAQGCALSLQQNFRSRPEILTAVNRVFEVLMCDTDAGALYDEDSKLRRGRTTSPSAAASTGKSAPAPARVEVHLLPAVYDRNATAGSPQNDVPAADGEESDADASEESESPDEPVSRNDAIELGFSAEFDASRWSVAEREAFLVGSRIQQWRRDGDCAIDGRPMQYRDVAVLLRSAKFKAEQMVSLLSRMGIPARAETGGSLFASVEVRDVLAALRVLDNPQQDIPLAAVLRNGIFGKPFSADELVEIRCLNREVPFHAAVRGYLLTGESESLRDRLRRILQRVDEYRHEAKLSPLSNLIWRLYEREGYLAYAAALPHGEQRRANLLRLHELARSFGTFRRQGLHRFIRFVDSLDAAEQSVDTAAPLGESEDVVRVMSIHRAKGLEFPVVFVTGLGSAFNLQERHGRMIFERSAKIGLRVVDRAKMIEYPSAPHLLVGAEIDRCTRQEEMRILYVAMTRARDRLVLVGTPTTRSRARSTVLDIPSTAHARASAASMLDWILPIVRSPNASVVTPTAADATTASSLAPVSTSSNEAFDLHEHALAEVLGWRITPAAGIDDRSGAANEDAVHSAVVRAAPLPAAEPADTESSEVDEILHRIAHVYPYLSVTGVAATSSASRREGSRGTFGPICTPQESDGLARQRVLRPTSNGVQPGVAARSRLTPGFEAASEASIGDERRDAGRSADEAIRRGVATHLVLQHLDFFKAIDAAGLALELQRMTVDGRVARDDADLVDLGGLEWFLGTPLAERIRDAGDRYRRELSYIAAESPTFFDPGVMCDASDFALVRGIVDGILLSDEGAEIVDFKTDSVPVEAVNERAKRYAPQMELYSRAVRRLFRRPVTGCRLVFLSARRIVDWPPCSDTV